MDTLLIIIHATTGGLAWICGLAAASLPKGKKWHRLLGRGFVYLMLFSAIIAIIVANLPEHKSYFLLSIAILTIYLTAGGYLAWIGFRGNHLFEKILAFSMLLTGVCMAIIPLLVHGKFNIVLLVFGCVGMLLSILDFRVILNPDKLKNNRIFMHIGKMTGGLISATTAFVVVNNLLPGLYGWFGPTFLGGVFIFYYINKNRIKQKLLSEV
jgi:hypothetical protein